MRTKTRKIALVLYGLLLANLPSMASVKPINCHTNFGEKSFTIQDNTVAFHQDRDDGRSISSVLSARTQASKQGFKKTLYKDGQRHVISILNLDKFSPNDDFLAVTSRNGHKMTFPLNCQTI